MGDIVIITKKKNNFEHYKKLRASHKNLWGSIPPIPPTGFIIMPLIHTLQ